MRNLLALALLGACCVTPSSAHTHRRRRIPMEATAAVSHFHPTAAGTLPHYGVVAADPAVLPLGTRIRITGAGPYNGFYLVSDTGDKIVGRHIDLYLPTAAQARRFGKKIVYVRVLEMGTGKEDARAEDPSHVLAAQPGTAPH